MKPSLFSLFQRSKYRKPSLAEAGSKEDNSQEVEERWRQCERFAVAAIAYCLKCDSRFFGNFLRNVCGCALESASAGFDILIEHRFWGDLVLIGPNESVVYVVECKIDAPLEDHQNPSTRMFWTNGYGKAILDRFRNSTTRRYVVLGYEEELSKPKGVGIECLQRYWANIEMEKPTPIISDLYNCLGNLEVRTFRSRIASTMKRAATAQTASETYAVLRAAYDHLGLAKEKFSPEIDYDTHGDWWDFGLAIHSSRREADSRSEHGRLQRAVSPTRAEIGWFGYSQADQESGVCFSVWFYCNKNTQRKLRDRLKSRFGNRYVQLRSTEAENYVEVRMPKTIAEQEIREGDQEWFVSVIQAAMKS